MPEPIAGLYGLKNAFNGKWYIGQTTDLATRKVKHFYLLRSGRHPNAHLQAAYAQYGPDCFEWRVIELVSEELLDHREVAWIRFYDSLNPDHGYNIEGGGNKQKHISAETRNKISKSKLGKPNPGASHPMLEETKQKIRLAHLGKANQGHRGHPITQATRDKISLANKGRTVWNKKPT